MQPRLRYIRDENNHPLAVFATIDGKNNLVHIGFSVCSKKDQFVKSLGRNIAISRAHKQKEIFENKLANNRDEEKLCCFGTVLREDLVNFISYIRTFKSKNKKLLQTTIEEFIIEHEVAVD